MPLDFGPIVGRIRAAAPGAVLLGAEYLKGEAQRRTPVESGDLRGSADARPAGAMRAEVYYPGPYARYQHFGLDFRHEEGQALYLEEPTVSAADGVVRVVGLGLRGVFE